MIIDKEYPDGTEEVVSLLEIFPVLERKQILIYLMQNDLSFNEMRAEMLVAELEQRGLLVNDKGNISLYKAKKPSPTLIDAFWVFLDFVGPEVVFDEGRYPAEIVFKVDSQICEVIVCDGDFIEKMDFLSKRKKRKNDCKYYILLLSDNIEEIDESLFPDTSFSVITMQKKKDDVPKMVHHEVYTEDK